MFRAQDPEKSGCNRYHAISLLLANDPNLLAFIFGDSGSAILPDVFTGWIAEGLEMDSQTERLIAFALAIWWEWSGPGLYEACRYLGGIRFHSFLIALAFLATTGGCGCQNCRQRIGDSDAQWTAIP